MYPDRNSIVTIHLVIVCLKGQCISITAIQSCVISQPVQSVLNIVLQGFVEFAINKKAGELCEVKLEPPSKYSEG